MLGFLGIGAQKAGTTWLYEQLVRHPRVRFPGGKEVHFWNARIHTDPLDWYLRLFDGGSGVLEGDITPGYAILDPDVICAIRKHFPHLKILFIMRNPVERAWSAALMALGRAEMEIGEASDRWFIDHFLSQGSMLRGDYVRTLQNWTEVFGRDQVLPLFYDRLESDPLGFLRECSRFLGLDWSPAWSAGAVGERIFEGSRVPLRPSLVQPLLDLYGPRVAALEMYLGVDLEHWCRKYR